jgi:hypothetical protein
MTDQNGKRIVCGAQLATAAMPGAGYATASEEVRLR